MSQSQSPSMEPVPQPQRPVADPQSVVLEALRLAYASTGAEQYRGVYEQLRGRIEQRRAPGQPASAAIPSAPTATAPAPLRAGETPLGAGCGAAQAVAPAVIRVVCATRQDREGFFASTALGRSLTLHRPDGVEVRLFPRNAKGLSTVYNTAIAESVSAPAILLFVHDDVHLCDFHWTETLRSGLDRFDIIGLAGNRRRVRMQPAWGCIDEKFTRDKWFNLSGTVAHGKGFSPESVDEFGPSKQRVLLLDGLFLAARSETLQAKSLRFDERFDFHFYDLDFCRQAEQANLTMGTWPISVVHESPGGYSSGGWRRGYEIYLDKWRE